MRKMKKALLIVSLICFQRILTYGQKHPNRRDLRLAQLETKLNLVFEKLNKLESKTDDRKDFKHPTVKTYERNSYERDAFERKTEGTLLAILEAMQTIAKKLEGRSTENSFTKRETQPPDKEVMDATQTLGLPFMEKTTNKTILFDLPMLKRTENLMMTTMAPDMKPKNPSGENTMLTNSNMNPTEERNILKRMYDLEMNIQEMHDELSRKIGRLQRSISEQMDHVQKPAVSQESFDSRISRLEYQIDNLRAMEQKYNRDIQLEMRTIQHLLNLELGVALRAMHNDLMKCSRSSINMRYALSKVLSESVDGPLEESQARDDPLSYLVSSRRAQTMNRLAQLDDLGGVSSLELVNSKPSSCAQIFLQGYTKSGIYTIWPRTSDNTILQLYAYCDMETNGGGWTVFQRRGDFGGKFENFTRPWNDYKNGFGKVSQEFWLGNEAIHALSSQEPVMLRVELYDWNGEERFAEYGLFEVSDEDHFYGLIIGNFSGDVPDSFLYHNESVFSTFDRNNANFSSEWCIMLQGQAAGWWYKPRCYMAKLNAPYKPQGNVGRAEGIQWRQWRGYEYSLKGCEMKVRPRCFQQSCKSSTHMIKS